MHQNCIAARATNYLWQKGGWFIWLHVGFGWSFPKMQQKKKTSVNLPLIPTLSSPTNHSQEPCAGKSSISWRILQITPFLNSDKTHNSKSICIWYICIQGHLFQTLISKRQCKGSKSIFKSPIPRDPYIFHSKSCVPWPPVQSAMATWQHSVWHQPTTAEHGLAGGPCLSAHSSHRTEHFC